MAGGYNGWIGGGGGGGGGARGRAAPAGRQRSAAPSLWDYIGPLLICSIFVCALLAGVLALHLSLNERHKAAAPQTIVAPGAPATASGGGGSGATASSTSNDAGTVQAAPAAVWDERLSAQAERLSDAELHGGWQLTWQTYDRATKHPNATVLSWAAPRVLLIRDFLAPREVQHLIDQASGAMERSEVVSDAAKQHEQRTSSGAWLSGQRRTDTVRAVQRRIHDLVGIPEQFGESIHVLRYALGQRYDQHNDNCATYPGDASSPSCREFLQRAGGPGCGPGAGGVTCGDRLATFILYLKSPTRGGSTVFPRATRYHVDAGAVHGAAQQGGQASGLPSVGGSGGSAAGSLAQSRRLQQAGDAGAGAEAVPWYCVDGAAALQVAPPPGSAVLFWDYVPAGSQFRPGDVATPDPTAIHGGCPVLEGEKVIATRWIRAADFH